MRERVTQCDRVKKWLLERGSITTGEALHVMKPEIRQLHQRIAELEARGLVFSRDWVRDSNGRKTKEYRYTLVNRPRKKVAVHGANGVIFVPEEYAKAHAMRILD
jgi:hypothetical protein